PARARGLRRRGRVRSAGRVRRPRRIPRARRCAPLLYDAARARDARLVRAAHGARAAPRARVVVQHGTRRPAGHSAVERARDARPATHARRRESDGRCPMTSTLAMKSAEREAHAREAQAIRAASARWLAAVDARDPARAAAVYADDGVFLVPNAP